MRRWISRLAVVSTFVVAAPEVLAGAGVLNTVVEPLSTNVTYSLPGPPALITYVGYKVTIANAGGNTINNIRFTGATAANAAAELAVFDSAEGASCVTTNAAQTAISCSIGQLTAGTAFPTFAVFFKAPAKVTNGVADADGSDALSFSGTTFYAEGTGGPNSVPQNSQGAWNPPRAEVQLGTSNPTLIKSSVPKAGGTFYTGAAGVATPADPLTTIVTVPGRTVYTTAEVAESTIAQSCSPNPAFCLSTSLAIPGEFAFLEITLRRDASTIAKGAKIADAQLFYSSDPAPALGTPIGPCDSAGQVPAGQLRCILSRTAYTKKTAPTPEFEGDWEFVVRALENGRISW